MMKSIADITVGSLYRFKPRMYQSPAYMNMNWFMHDDSGKYMNVTIDITTQWFFVLDVKLVPDQSPNLLSVKILCNKGNVGRIYIYPNDWERIPKT